VAEHEHMQAAAAASQDSDTCGACIVELGIMKGMPTVAPPAKAPSTGSVRRFSVRCGVNCTWPMKEAVEEVWLCYMHALLTGGIPHFAQWHPCLQFYVCVLLGGSACMPTCMHPMLLHVASRVLGRDVPVCSI
jgi:hypothetical protein